MNCKLKNNKLITRKFKLPIILILFIGYVIESYAVGVLKFNDITTNSLTGINYERVKSKRDKFYDIIKAKPLIPFTDAPNVPLKSQGAPGVAIFDFDNDGDEDIYVTNGPSVANSLYVNQLKETGTLSFIDKGISSGLAAKKQDSSGICYGDIDNDGDEDLLVLASCGKARLYENQGHGKFKNISSRLDTAAANKCSSSCSFGDVNGDGLLDVVVANTSKTWDNRQAILNDPFSKSVHNQLYINKGHNTFVDHSVSSGINNTKGFPASIPGSFDGSPTITWAIALVDYDLDGDLDLIHADDQGGIDIALTGGVDRGYIRIFQNDGKGHFTDVTTRTGMNAAGNWMGLSFGDINCDGQMDLFASNTGDYPSDIVGETGSRWFLGNTQGGFTDSKDTIYNTPSVFGWGTGMADYDNDGDIDIMYHGGLAFAFRTDASNPGVFLQNQNCSGKMNVDVSVMSSTDHKRRTVHGMALGDIDNNGFTDIVSVSNFNIPTNWLLTPFNIFHGSPLDSASYTSIFTELLSEDLIWDGRKYNNGNLSVEISNGSNNNNWIKVKLLGTKNIIHKGKVNRNGIGAVVFVTPFKGKTSMKPIIGGASYASQNSLNVIFGLGKAKKANIEILWPGGLRNNYYGIKMNQALVLPEIPCNYQDIWATDMAYKKCVRHALRQLFAKKLITKKLKRLIFRNAIRSYKKNKLKI